MKRKALRVRSEGSIHSYVTEAESRKQHSDSPLCNSLKSGSVVAIVWRIWIKKEARPLDSAIEPPSYTVC